MGVLLQACKTVSLVLFYYSFSISLTFYNKWILTGYPFPLSITMIHLIIKFLIAWVVRKIISLVTGKPPLVLGWREYLRNISPVSVFSALDIGLSNWSLVFITVSLYTMSKSTALIFILVFAVLFKLEPPALYHYQRAKSLKSDDSSIQTEIQSLLLKLDITVEAKRHLDLVTQHSTTDHHSKTH